MRVVEPPGTISLGEKVLTIDGSSATESTALLPFPVRDSFELTPLVTLVKTPAVTAVTVTLIEQVEEAEIVPAERLIKFPPAVSDPPHVLDGVPETVIPAGNVSVNATPVSASEFKFPRVKDNVVVVPTGITDGVNALLIVGRMVAEAGKQGLVITVRGLYCAAFEKSFVVTPGISFPKLNTQLLPLPACEKNGYKPPAGTVVVSVVSNSMFL